MGRGPGSIPLVGKRAFYIELMKTGISNSAALSPGWCRSKNWPPGEVQGRMALLRCGWLSSFDLSSNCVRLDCSG